MKNTKSKIGQIPKRPSKNTKTSFVSRMAQRIQKHKVLTVGLLFAVIGGVLFVYQTFAMTDTRVLTNSTAYTFTTGDLKLGAQGICNFTTKVVPAAPGSFFKVGSVKCDVRDDGFRDTAEVYTESASLGPWSAGKYYQACAMVAPDTPVGIEVGRKLARAKFGVTIQYGESWGDSQLFTTGYSPQAPFRYSEFCTFMIRSDGTQRQLKMSVNTKFQDASFRVSQITLKEYIRPNEPAATKNPQPQTLTQPAPSK